MAANATGYAVLERRGVVAVAGEDRAAFLQGLVSNDVTQVREDHAAYALFLTPQGKFLHDFLLIESGGALLLDPEMERRADLLRRLKMYKLRSKIALEDRADSFRVVVAFGAGALAALGLPEEAGAARPFGGGVAVTDPRLPALGARLYLPADGLAALDAVGLERREIADYDRLRLSLGVPDGAADMVPEKAIPLENRLDALNAISWSKGCYMGQELTARTKYRALIKKKLFPVTLDGPLPAPGAVVTMGEKEVGEIRSGLDNHALALLRLEDIGKQTGNSPRLQVDGVALSWRAPEWDNAT